MRDGRPVTYIINLRGEEMRLKLLGWPEGKGAVDLISGRRFEGPILEVRPLDVLLLVPK